MEPIVAKVTADVKSGIERGLKEGPWWSKRKTLTEIRHTVVDKDSRVLASLLHDYSLCKRIHQWHWIPLPLFPHNLHGTNCYINHSQHKIWFKSKWYFWFVKKELKKESMEYKPGIVIRCLTHTIQFFLLFRCLPLGISSFWSGFSIHGRG